MSAFFSNLGTKLKAAWDSLSGKTVPAHVFIVLLGLALIFGGCMCGGRSGSTPAHSFGWLDDPAKVSKVVSTFANPYFGDAAKNLLQGAEDKDALLYKAFEKATGKPWEPHDQDGTGCCVGEGNSGAVELLSAVEIALGVGDRQDYQPISAAAVYALAREVGGDLGNQDGAVGADAAKALQALGAISCEEAKDTDGRGNTAKDHGALAKKWGRTGLPKELKPLLHKVKTVSLVRTPEEARAALINGYPVTICSSVGFEGGGGFKRDANGFCKPGGTWPHCMFVGGYRADRKAFLVFQSWGPSQPPGPKSLDQPDGTFWIEWSAMQRVLKSGDCYALSSFDGYKSRDLPFFIRAPRAHEPVFALVP